MNSERMESDSGIPCSICGGTFDSVGDLVNHECDDELKIVTDGGVETADAEAETKYGDLIADHEWNEPPEPGGQGHPVEVSHHMLTINDERESIERYNGYRWDLLIEDGTITAVDRSHYCPGPGHVDPMGFVAWDDVPPSVRRAALRELNGTVDEVVDVESTKEVVR